MRISNNVPALMVHTNLIRNDRLLKLSVMRLSSGFRINSAKEDPTGLAITNKLTFQITGQERASENASHGISLVQTAEGALAEVHNMLQRMRELAVYAANGVLENEDREKIQVEIDELLAEINLIADRTEFNKIKLLSGEAARVNESIYNDATDRSITRILYISDQTPADMYEYTIKAIGSPPVVTGEIDPTDTTPGGTIFINGEKIEVPAGMTIEQSLGLFTTTLYHHGLEYHHRLIDDTVTPNRYAACLIGNVAGADQKLELSGDEDTLAFFGLRVGEFTGTDADIEVTSHNLNYRTNGNQVRILGANGEEIKINLQVIFASNSFTDEYAHFSFGGNRDLWAGSTFYDIATDTIHHIANPGDPLQAEPGLLMQLDVKSYGQVMLQIGASYNNAMAVQIPKLNAETIGLVEFKAGVMHPFINYKNYLSAGQAITITDNAIQIVSTVRARLGSFQNRLESSIRSLDVAVENTSQSRSLIRDTDVAKETTAYATRNLMYQAGLAVLAQANMRPQQILSLLQ